MIFVKNISLAVGGLLIILVGMWTIAKVAPGLLSQSTEITVIGSGSSELGRTLKMTTNVRQDGIPAIMDPKFVPAEVANFWMDPSESVLALSVNGDHRAYPITMLSHHEIVNDVVGGKPLAVTW